MRITWVILNLSLHFIGIIQAGRRPQAVNYPIPAQVQSQPLIPPPEFRQFQSLSLRPPVAYVQNSTPQSGYREGPPTYKEGPNLDSYQIGKPPLCAWNASDTDEEKLLGPDEHYHTMRIRCCDSDLEANLKESIKLGINAEKLGDAAKFIQRRAQLEFRTTFEVIITERNFAIASYYHGCMTCKIMTDDYHVLIYQTPNRYDPFNLKFEEWFAALDAQEDLGSTKALGVRGYFPDKREDPMAGGAKSHLKPKSLLNDKVPDKVDDGETLTKKPKKRVHPRKKNSENRREKRQAEDTNLAPIIDAPEELEEVTEEPLPASTPVPVTPVTRRRTTTTHAPTSAVHIDSAIASETRLFDNNFAANSINIDRSHSPADANLQVPVVATEIEAKDERKGPDSEQEDNDNYRWNLKFPKESHCHKCCDRALTQTVRDAVTELSTSPWYGAGSEGVIAGRIQRMAQLRFERSYEVFVSRHDFAFATYHVGNAICHQFYKEFYILIYATPRQYDVDYQEAENYFFNFAERENLGSTEITLPEMKDFHTPLSIEAEGPRAGFPVNSHCDQDHRGSYCCNVQLFNSLLRAYQQIIRLPNFHQYNMRQFSRRLQWDAEELFQHSMEVFVSYDDFIFNVNYANDSICKFRVDKYYIFAYTTNSNITYPLHWPVEVDLGEAKPMNCPPDLEKLDGVICCDRNMQYDMFKTIDVEKQKEGFNRHQTQFIATAILRKIQRRFNTTFESILTPADFIWQTGRFSDRTCKIDAGMYNVLAYQSSYLAKEADKDKVRVKVKVKVKAKVKAKAKVKVKAKDKVKARDKARAKDRAAANQFAAAQFAQANSFAIANQFAAAVPPPPAVAPPIAPPGGGLGNTCFSSDTWLTTPNGKKRMDEIEVGDFILTANETHIYFTPILMWLHKEPEVNASFITIITEFGKALRLTDKHLMYMNECGDYYEEYIDFTPTKPVYADELRIGQCVIVIHKGRFRQQRIESIFITQRKGIYAPLTSNGRLIVNDMLASCHSNMKEVIIQYKFAEVFTRMRRAVSDFISESSLNELVPLPVGIELLLIPLSLFHVALSSYCGQSAIPFTFQVLRSGHPVLGCARPKCFGWNANGTRAADSVQFYRINEKEDGYLRRSDQVTKNPSKDPQYQPKTSICSERYTDSCRPDEWVGGLAPQEDPQSSPLKVRCCSYHMLEVSEDRGVATVKQGQLVVGGEYMEADKLLGFDYISNLQKSFYDNGTIYYSVTIKRMQCQDDESVFPEAELNLVQGGSKTTTTEPSSQDNAIVHYPIGRADESQQISKTAPRQVQPSINPSPTPAASNSIQSQPYSSTANTVVSQPTQINYPQPQTSNIQPLPSHNPIAQGVTTVQGYPQVCEDQSFF
ncbi:hypothetical protein WR25_09546 isoform F [Diploscapter pachys]|uniref:Hint domain-containing protein n=1 Tax=Diploscapter pachys TaxID=2018661 RepID=A0A2A2KX09_9BILA|nr:hypothetical protein WR25_09546 isoform C [Diploscapter pachys]PAV78485.1 hypothetical protein WR25_09546 isoform D [Diploscapter pachys]PAV78487.1 hypothetical protein WR25_09546 isoform F [Diploscapter pachys]